MERLYGTYGSVACLAQGGNRPLLFRPGPGEQQTVFAFGAARNREVLTQPDVFESDVLRGPSGCDWLVDNLASANRQARSEQRRMMMPAFTRGHLSAYYPTIVTSVRKALDGWKPDVRVDVMHAVEELTADIGCRCFYGQDPDDGRQSLAAIARDVAQALFSPVSAIPINLPGSPYRRFLRLAEHAGDAVWREISLKREQGLQGDDVLSMMIKAHDEGEFRLSRAELIGNAFTLFLAGHDVPANALCLTIYLLAQHPDVSASLLDELEHHLQGGPPTFEQIWKLPVLDSVFREALRILSPAVFLWRRVTSDTVLGDFEIRKGTEILLSPYVTHRDPATYERPRRFRPERWEVIRPSPFEYLPFSYGFRKCLGAAFAEIEIKIALAMLMQRFRLELIPGTRLPLAVTFTMRPKHGLPMIVRRQDREFRSSPAQVSGKLREIVCLPHDPEDAKA